MRYRPLANQPMTVSAVSLRLDDSIPRNVSGWAALCVAALESGINCFEVASRNPSLIDGLAQALKTVERRLLFIAWRLGPNTMPPQLAAAPFSALSMDSLVRAVIARTGLQYLDLVQLDDPGERDLSAAALQALKRLKAEGRVRMIGIAGEGDEIDAYISTNAFDLLCTPYNMLSGWRDRRRIRAACEHNMSVIGYDFFPQAMLDVVEESKPKRGLLSWGKKASAGVARPYSFLHSTADWSAEEICLAYVLTEPALATVQLAPLDIAHIQALADVPERDLPAGIPAQIEMSRFGAGKTG